MNDRITSKDLIQQVTEQTQQDKKVVEEIVNATFEQIYEAIKQGNTVSLRNFGTFYVRPERNSWVFRFNPSQKLRSILNWSSTYKGKI